MLLANVTDPCFEFGYTLYIGTEVHGKEPLEATVDLYTLDKKKANE